MYISGSLSKLSRLAWAGHDVRLTSPQKSIDSGPRNGRLLADLGTRLLSG